MFNPTTKDTFFYYDEEGLILENFYWGDGGKGDSVGRNAFEYICRPNQPFIKIGIDKCIKKSDNGLYYFYRYPNFGAESMSRDHVGAILLSYFVNKEPELDDILKNLPFRLNKKTYQTIDFWLWQKSLRFKWVSNLFYLLNILIFIFIVPYNYLIRTLLRIKKIDLYNGEKSKPFKPKSIKWYINKTIYPYFAFFFLCWQIKVLPNNFLKTILCKLLLFESNNPVTNCLLGQKIKKEEYENYKAFSFFQWSRRLDITDDVTMDELKDFQYKENDISKSMLDYLYFEIDNLMLNYKMETIIQIKEKKQIINY